VTGIVMAMLGFFLFIVGAKLSLIPMGVAIGQVLADAPMAAILGFAFVLGAAVAFAEPAVRILAFEIDEVSAGSLRKRLISSAVALGVGLAVVVSRPAHRARAAARGRARAGLRLAIVLTLFTPRDMVPAALRRRRRGHGPRRRQLRLPLTTGMAHRAVGRGRGCARLRRGGDHRAGTDHHHARAEPLAPPEGIR
jgi:hypothetical protein